MSFYDQFEVKGDKVERKYKTCPEEGDGFRMGEHSDRWMCGHCGYTEWKDGKKRR